MDDEALLEVLAEAARAVRSALDGLDDWRPAGTRPGQYRLDLVADAAALDVLHTAGLRVLSEESGVTGPAGVPEGAGQGILVVLDPVDGSTNASLGIPWFATSLCVLDGDGPRAALVVNQASGVHYEAVRGGGARRDGRLIAPSGCRKLSEAVVGISGLPERHPGWAQFRALGSAALDHCAVAEGALDGYLPVGGSSLYAWDYLGGMLVCTEAGAVVGELHGNELVARDDSRRWPAAAATPELLEGLLAAEA
jgi:myo-inositol-1(or 4)-monophosphatase